MKDLAAAIDEENINKFTDVVKEYDSMIRLVNSRHFLFCIPITDYLVMLGYRNETLGSHDRKVFFEMLDLFP